MRNIGSASGFQKLAHRGGHNSGDFFRMPQVVTFLQKPDVYPIAKPILDDPSLLPTEKINALCKALAVVEHSLNLEKAKEAIAKKSNQLVSIEGIVSMKEGDFNPEKRYTAKLMDNKGNQVVRYNEDNKPIPVINTFDKYHMAERWLANKQDKDAADYYGLIIIGQPGDADHKTVKISRDEAARTLNKRMNKPVMAKGKGSDGDFTKIKASGDHFSFSRG